MSKKTFKSAGASSLPWTSAGPEPTAGARSDVYNASLYKPSHHFFGQAEWPTRDGGAAFQPLWKEPSERGLQHRSGHFEAGSLDLVSEPPSARRSPPPATVSPSSKASNNYAADTSAAGSPSAPPPDAGVRQSHTHRQHFDGQDMYGILYQAD